MESDRRSTNGGDPSISSFSDDTNFTTWDDMVYAQSAMYKDSVRNNVVLRSQVEKMRNELEVWKMGFNTKAREKEELEAKVARLETEIQTMAAQQVSVKEKEVLETKVARMERSLTAIHEENPLVVCVVDGDGAVFSEMYLTRGREGGRDAAAAFNTAIKSHLDIHNDGVNNVMGSQSVSDSDEFNTSSRRIVSPQILCTIYFNRGGLCPTLLKNGVCTAQDFHDFCIGFNQALPLFTLIDVGDGKEAADTKVRKSLELFARLPQTRKVFFAGAHDNGYMPTLMSLRTEGHLRKLVLMKGYSTVAYEFEMFLQETAVDVMDLPDLFLKQKLVSAGHPRLQRQPLSSPGVSHQSGSSPSPVDASGGRLPAEGLTSPKTWSSNVQSAQAGLKQPQSLSFPGHKFDPKKSVARQTPPPCIAFYLNRTKCRFDDSACKYSHSYELSPAQVEEFRLTLSKQACPVLRLHNYCNQGPNNCHYTHHCPAGSKCPKLAATKKCAFIHPSDSAPIQGESGASTSKSPLASPNLPASSGQHPDGTSYIIPANRNK